MQQLDVDLGPKPAFEIDKSGHHVTPSITSTCCLAEIEGIKAFTSSLEGSIVAARTKDERGHAKLISEVEHGRALIVARFEQAYSCFDVQPFNSPRGTL